MDIYVQNNAFHDMLSYLLIVILLYDIEQLKPKQQEAMAS
ncbi:hypothetical protein Psal071_00243 [Piscirickettsia salmonis]|uniref:Uncharacterized protein n=1 Tax=Piscirickettsia salmonis TaxID=1238 RepID=A0A9Q6LHV2_PISSA|nr:hypothetical protein KW89_2831 [Piscirickettsia salmonis]ERL62774.1 hypothetical protein K661_00872 [Piscirickettsia salmonis LF-89 = ATCC VR-1361]QGN76077.1 hypothetical protein Psal001_00245 [Piscirickettsia salmonis]QGN79640.1 hypothetical protein Psal002_00243 [Piscirickettsia salmonis]QGN83229.1 hypothetical protein Psal003_00242 [Piscirickettsia salmonis]